MADGVRGVEPHEEFEVLPLLPDEAEGAAHVGAPPAAYRRLLPVVADELPQVQPVEGRLRIERIDV